MKSEQKKLFLGKIYGKLGLFLGGFWVRFGGRNLMSGGLCLLSGFDSCGLVSGGGFLSGVLRGFRGVLDGGF